LVASGIAMGLEGRAAAFCRKTTCLRDCEIGDDGCDVYHEDRPPYALRWKRDCVSYSLDATNIRSRDLNATLVLVNRAFRAWTETKCADPAQPTASPEPISISASHAWGVVLCDHIEYNYHQGNANIVTFRNPWPYEIDTPEDDELGRTTVTYLKDTGEIVDADIEIRDDAKYEFTTTTPVPNFGYDLQSILTHEVGHFLGLAHSNVPPGTEAVMLANLLPGGDFQKLREDDSNGICKVYQPHPTTLCEFTPQNGFSAECALDPTRGGNCDVNRRPAPYGFGAGFLSIGALVALARSRRRARRY
jgi:hypothetical protein